MNVVFLTNSVGYGGAEKIMNFVTDYLSTCGHTVTIVNYDTVQSDIAKYPQSLNSSVRVITLDGDDNKSHLSRILKTRSITKEVQADVILAFTMFPNFYAKIISMLTGVPSIMSERGDPNITFTDNPKDKFIRYVINKSKGAVFQTEYAAKYYSKQLQKRGIVIPNPIFLSGTDIPLVGIKERDKTVVSVGRLQNVQKRYDIMLYAFKDFSNKYTDYTLKLYGSGEDEAFIRELICKLELTDKVVLMGAIKNPINHIYNAGMFLITSDYEGIPNALLEAMAAGLPVVATDCTPGGARMLITNNENGQLVPLRDVKAITEALIKYASDLDFANKCANNAKNVLNIYDPAKIGAQWVTYISRIAGL